MSLFDNGFNRLNNEENITNIIDDIFCSQHEG